MTEMSERDWELVNAYHDGELDPIMAQALEARLEIEPELASALGAVSALSNRLVAIRGELSGPCSASRSRPTSIAATNVNRAFLGWAAGGLLAAGIALAVLLGPVPFQQLTPYDLHRQLSDGKMAKTSSVVQLVSSASREGLPDLTAANLTPVEMTNYDDGTAAHYVGPNGCQLTYFSAPRALDLSAVPGTAQTASWSGARDDFYAIIAGGMDRNKFEAIAAYLKQVTRQSQSDTIFAALSNATAAAGPCVG